MSWSFASRGRRGSRPAGEPDEAHLDSCAEELCGPFAGPTSAEHVPHVLSFQPLIYSLSQRSNQESKFKTFFALMRDGARSHPTHSLTFMGLWDQKDRNSNSKSPAAV